MAASSSARVPHAVSVTSRSCGFAARPCSALSCPAAARCRRFFPVPGRPNAAALAGLSGALMVVPSTATTSSPPRCDQAARPGDSAEHSRRNSDSSGFSPIRARALLSAVDAGTRQPAAASALSSPPVTCRITSPYGSADSSAQPSTKYTPSRAGSDRSRISHASPSPTASSTRPGGITQVSTPIPARERIRPRSDSQPQDVAP